MTRGEWFLAFVATLIIAGGWMGVLWELRAVR